ncbi:MAG: SDR family NAD(P)-dependent oxidoreductase, partial [Spirochaetota bacterium]
ILNVSSLSAWLPIPGLAAYAAGKAYILHLTEGVNGELKYLKSNVHVSAVTPGFFNTEIAGKEAQMNSTGRDIPSFIRTVVKQFMAGKEVIVIGQDKKVPWIDALLPRWVGKKILWNAVKKTLVRKEGK